MGEVYLAEDSRLGRKVAVKVLPANFTGDEERIRRFAQEARAASALNHPNILTIYDIGQVENHHYIATEFIEGETLRQLLGSGRIPLGEALDIAIQATNALGAAHAAGIIHRDVKPENIMRRPDGYIKILDFGLAKLTEQSSGDLEARTRSLFETEPGMVVGTIAYMSPEQARGLRVDARTDFFSLGVVLYEMVTGKRPFTGETASDMLVSILDREPARLSHHLPGVPPDLEAVVTRLLTKDAEARYKTAAELLSDLKPIRARIEGGSENISTAPLRQPQGVIEESPTVVSVAGPSSPDIYATSLSSRSRTDETKAAVTGKSLGVPGFPRVRRWLLAVAAVLFIAGVGLVLVAFFLRDRERINSIAVLPFVNESADRNTEYLSDGITEGLINTLSRLPELSVKSRNSVFRFKGKQAGAQEVGNDLGVRAVLLGRVKQQGDELLINTELVDARDERQIWGEQFRRKASDLLALQEQMIDTISKQLRLRLTPAERVMISQVPTQNADAYQLYLRGRYYWNQGTPEALKQADEYFEKAVALDPKYALAIAGCASCHAFGANYGEPPSQSMPKAKQVALAAVKRDGPPIVDAYLVLARVSWMYDRDYATADRTFRRAIELEPANANAQTQYAQFLAVMGRSDEALTAIDRAVALDPASARTMLTDGMVLYFQRRYDQAIEALKKAVNLDPNLAAAHEWMGIVYERKGMRLEAIEQYLTARRITSDRPDYLSTLKGAYARDGWQGYWRKELENAQERAAAGYVPAAEIAEIYLRLDDRKQALVWLGKACDERDGRIVALKVDPAYDGLRGDRRLDELVKRVGLAL
jgi:serine/threonine-protein kinase